MLRITQKTARARVHGSNHHEGYRIRQALCRPADTDLAIFEGLAQHFQGILFKLLFIEEEHAIVSQIDIVLNRLTEHRLDIDLTRP